MLGEGGALKAALWPIMGDWQGFGAICSRLGMRGKGLEADRVRRAENRNGLVVCRTIAQALIRCENGQLPTIEVFARRAFLDRLAGMDADCEAIARCHAGHAREDARAPRLEQGE